jgi:DNA-binding response OmpR family regulator
VLLGEPTPRVIEGHGERVLFVDDERVLVDVFCRRLEQAGYRVYGTTDAHDALDVFSRDPTAFDLVITDFMMPRMTGLDLAHQLSALREGVPIIILTGNAGDISPQRSAAAGVSLVGQKPLSFAELTAHMEQLLGRGDTAGSR